MPISWAAAFIFLPVSWKVPQRNVFANRTSGSWYLPHPSKKAGREVIAAGRDVQRLPKLWCPVICSSLLLEVAVSSLLHNPSGDGNLSKGSCWFLWGFDQILTELLDDFKWAKTSHILFYPMQWPTALKFPGSQLAEELKKRCHLAWLSVVLPF